MLLWMVETKATNSEHNFLICAELLTRFLSVYKYAHLTLFHKAGGRLK